MFFSRLCTTTHRLGGYAFIDLCHIEIEKREMYQSYKVKNVGKNFTLMDKFVKLFVSLFLGNGSRPWNPTADVPWNVSSKPAGKLIQLELQTKYMLKVLLIDRSTKYVDNNFSTKLDAFMF